MEDLQRLLIEHACKRLNVIYAHALDHFDAEAMANVFTSDAVLKLGSRDQPFVGNAAIRQWIATYPRDTLIRHVSSNVLIDVLDEGRAKGSSYTTAYKQLHHHGKGPAVLERPFCVVEYQDEFVRSAEGWRIKSREFNYIFKAG